MNGGGPGSGIWKSTDGGETWTRAQGRRLPEGPLGRIALDVYRKRPNILYALDRRSGAGRGGRGAAARREGAGDEGAGGGGAAEGGRHAGRGRGDRRRRRPATGLYRSDDARRDVAQGEQRQPAADVLQPGAHRSRTIPTSSYCGGVGLQMSHRRRQDGRHADVAESIHDDVHAIWIDPAQLESRADRQRRRPGASAGIRRRPGLLPQPAGRALLPRERRHGDAVQHLRRHAGQLQLVRPERRCAAPPASPTTTGRRSRAATASSCCRIRPTTAIVYSESQDGNMVRIDRVTGETMSIRPHRRSRASRRSAGTGTRRSFMSPHDPKIIYVAGNRVFRSADRGLTWDADQPATSRRNADRDEIVTMGVKGSDITIAKNDGIVGLADDRRRSPNRRRRPACSTPAPTTATLQVSRDGGKTWTNVTDKVPNLPKGVCVSRGRAVAVRRRHRLRDVRRPSPERLRDLHLRQQRLRPDVAVGRGEPEGRSRSRR